MRDRPLILGGLGLFLALVTFPFWYNVARGKTARPPDIKLPAEARQCVAPAAYMKASHMELLSQWRDDVVRRQIRTYVAHDGKTYEISLTRTCLAQCHTGKEEFCDRCHTYAGVKGPYCWDCHVDAKQGVMRAEVRP